jgi:hypothetical protein
VPKEQHGMGHEQNSRRQSGVGKAVGEGKVIKVKGGKEQKECAWKVLNAVDRSQAVVVVRAVWFHVS